MISNRTYVSTALAGVLAAVAFEALGTAGRSLVEVSAPGHDPLFVDTATIQRQGPVVSFNYVLNVLAAAEGRSVPGRWKSNEVETTIDCARNTFSSRRVVAYTGPRATGSITGSYAFTAQERESERIIPQSTIAHLAAHLCPAK